MIFVNARAFRGTDSHNLLDRWPDRVAWLGFTTTYKTAGTAKLRGSHIRRRPLWVGLWVGKSPQTPKQPLIHFPEPLSGLFRVADQPRRNHVHDAISPIDR